MEKAHGPAFRDEGEGLFVLVGDLLIGNPKALGFLDLAQAKGDEGEVGETEEVEFEESLRL